VSSIPLKGKELLAYVKENHPALSKTELTRGAGYFKLNRKGEQVLNKDGFTAALLEAKGVSLTDETRGRSAAFETTVHANGSILIGAIYAGMAGVGPGDYYGITVADDGSGTITLNLIERMEGSPRAVKVYDRPVKKNKAVVYSDQATETSAEPVAA